MKTQFKKGSIPWNKGTKGAQVAWNKGLTGLPPHHTTKHTKESKNKMSKSRKGKCCGSDNPLWKGGRVKRCNGYIGVLSKTHPFRDCQGYVMEHRLVMEQHIGRYLKKKEVVHHINSNTSDNRIENLELINNHSDHIKLHWKRKDYSKRRNKK